MIPKEDIRESRYLRFRFLFAGAVNTTFSYLFGIFLYKMLNQTFSVFIIGILSNLITLNFSFLTHKIFVFRTKGKWLNEYRKAYTVYGATSLIGALLLWVFIDFLSLSIWVAQAVTIAIIVLISYIGHKRYTFKREQA